MKRLACLLLALLLLFTTVCASANTFSAGLDILGSNVFDLSLSVGTDDDGCTAADAVLSLPDQDAINTLVRLGEKFIFGMNGETVEITPADILPALIGAFGDVIGEAEGEESDIVMLTDLALYCLGGSYDAEKDKLADIEARMYAYLFEKLASEGCLTETALGKVLDISIKDCPKIFGGWLCTVAADETLINDLCAAELFRIIAPEVDAEALTAALNTFGCDCADTDSSEYVGNIRIFLSGDEIASLSVDYYDTNTEEQFTISYIADGQDFFSLNYYDGTDRYLLDVTNGYEGLHILYDMEGWGNEHLDLRLSEDGLISVYRDPYGERTDLTVTYASYGFTYTENISGPFYSASSYMNISDSGIVMRGQDDDLSFALTAAENGTVNGFMRGDSGNEIVIVGTPNEDGYQLTVDGFEQNMYVGNLLTYTSQRMEDSTLHLLLTVNDIDCPECAPLLAANAVLAPDGSLTGEVHVGDDFAWSVSGAPEGESDTVGYRLTFTDLLAEKAEPAECYVSLTPSENGFALTLGGGTDAFGLRMNCSYTNDVSGVNFSADLYSTAGKSMLDLGRLYLRYVADEYLPAHVSGTPVSVEDLQEYFADWLTATGWINSVAVEEPIDIIVDEEYEDDGSSFPKSFPER